MKAILLAAGRGVRLHPYTHDRPKCLVECGGKALIETSFENLARAGIHKVVVVVGYLHEMIEERLASRFSPDFYEIIHNQNYCHGSGSSLMSAAEAIDGEFITVESDLLFSSEVIRRLLQGPNRNVLTLGNFNHGRREVKLYLEQGIIREAAWGEPDDPRAAGDWVGLSRFSRQTALELKSALQKALLREDREINYEDFIFDLIPRFPFATADVRDLPWIEVDNAEDLQNARRHVFPRIMAEREALVA